MYKKIEFNDILSEIVTTREINNNKNISFVFLTPENAEDFLNFVWTSLQYTIPLSNEIQVCKEYDNLKDTTVFTVSLTNEQIITLESTIQNAWQKYIFIGKLPKEIKKEINKLNIVDYSENTIEYLIKDGKISNSPWTVYSRIPAEELYQYRLLKPTVHPLYLPAPAYDEDHKIHLSFDQSKLKEAQDIILPLLEHRGVHNFKLIHSENTQYRNVLGKELTIYLQFNNNCAPENDPQFWISLFNDLENGLASKNIGKNPLFTAQGDQLFPGSKGYIYYRYPNNILNRYIKASDLNLHGFTRNEASYLSDDRFFEEVFKGLTLHNANLDILTTKATIKKMEEFTLKFSEEKTDQIIERYTNNIINASGIFFGEDEKGINKLKVNKKGLTKNQFEFHSCEIVARIFKSAFSFEFSEDYKRVYELTEQDIINLNDSTELLRQFISSCLLEAAKEVSTLQKTFFGDKKDIPIGNIVPILYHHFFLPGVRIAKEMRAMDANVPNQEITEAIVTELNKNRKEFIDKIVKCNFRDKTIQQIDHDFPQYIIEESKLNYAIRKYQQVSTSDTLLVEDIKEPIIDSNETIITLVDSELEIKKISNVDNIPIQVSQEITDQNHLNDQIPESSVKQASEINVLPINEVEQIRAKRKIAFSAGKFGIFESAVPIGSNEEKEPLSPRQNAINELTKYLNKDKFRGFLNPIDAAKKRFAEAMLNKINSLASEQKKQLEQPFSWLVEQYKEEIKSEQGYKVRGWSAGVPVGRLKSDLDQLISDIKDYETKVVTSKKI